MITAKKGVNETMPFMMPHHGACTVTVCLGAVLLSAVEVISSGLSGMTPYRAVSQ